jgi:hypothetical protein
MRNSLAALVAIVCLAAGPSARAEGIAITPNLNLTSGFGADLTLRVSPHFNVRVGGSIPMSPEVEDIKFGDIKYDMKLKLGGVNAFVDWHPFAGNFHVSAGTVTQRDPWTVKATSVSTYRVNGTSYPAAGVGTLAGEIRLGNKVAPALVVGWGNPVRPGKHLGFVFDAGLAYVGKQEFDVSASGPLASDATFKRDLEAERDKHSSEHAFSLIAKIGVSYQF